MADPSLFLEAIENMIIYPFRTTILSQQQRNVSFSHPKKDTDTEQDIEKDIKIVLEKRAKTIIPVVINTYMLIH